MTSGGASVTLAVTISPGSRPLNGFRPSAPYMSSAAPMTTTQAAAMSAYFFLPRMVSLLCLCDA